MATLLRHDAKKITLFVSKRVNFSRWLSVNESVALQSRSDADHVTFDTSCTMTLRVPRETFGRPSGDLQATFRHQEATLQATVRD